MRTRKDNMKVEARGVARGELREPAESRMPPCPLNCIHADDTPLERYWRCQVCREALKAPKPFLRENETPK